MNFLITTILFIIGLAILLKGADWFTEYASHIAKKLGISNLVIGLTLVAFATSLPELAVSLTAVFSNVTDIAIGNVIGSNIANVGLVIGLSAFLMPIAIKKQDLKECWRMLGLLVVAVLFMFNGLQRWEGLVLFAFLFFYIYYLFFKSGKQKRKKERNPKIYKDLAFCIVGASGVILGSRLLVDSAVTIAQFLGVSQVLISITIIAVGTSLPELATSVTAAVKGLREIAVGNIIGSNIFNIAAVLGLSSMVRAIPVTYNMAYIHAPIMVVFAALLYLVMRTGKKISRFEGGILLVIYAAFIGFLFL